MLGVNTNDALLSPTTQNGVVNTHPWLTNNANAAIINSNTNTFQIIDNFVLLIKEIGYYTINLSATGNATLASPVGLFISNTQTSGY